MAEVNPHLFLHRNLLGVDMVKDLEKFARSITDTMSNFEFHASMVKIFQRMDDAHTVYVLPSPLNSTVATLGFTVKQFFDPNDVTKDGVPRRRYVAFDVNETTIQGSAFGSGSELVTYNGERVDVAVKRAGIKSYGANAAVQIEYGTQLIVSRPLLVSTVPLEPTVEIGFRNLDGTEGTVTLPWLFLQMKETEMTEAVASRIAGLGSHHNVLKTSRIESKPNMPIISVDSVRVPEKGRIPIPLDPILDDIFSAEMVPTKAGVVGRLSIKSFLAQPFPVLIQELVRVLGLMPKTGLIVDIRDNPGGLPQLVKNVVELVSGKTVPEQPVTYRASKLLNDELSSLNQGGEDMLVVGDVSGIAAAVGTAFLVGEPFSGPTTAPYGPFSLSYGGAYEGPVVTLVNGLTYSAGDLYAALQVDQEMSLLVGTANSTGAGGSSTMGYRDLQTLFPSLDPLPNTVNYFTTALGRYFRTGVNAGAIVENFGVKPDIRYYPTYNDTMRPDCDLFDFLGKKLVEMGSGKVPEFGSPEPLEPLQPMESPDS